jgi:signal transduction histidine kinase
MHALSFDSRHAACYNQKKVATMSLFFQQIFELITTNPGNLAYHLVLAFSITGALQAAIVQWPGSILARRLVTGLGLMLGLRLVLFLAAALSWQNNLLSSAILPPLDRMVTFLSLIIIIWLWVFPIPHRIPDATAVILSLLVITLSVTGLIWWLEQGQGIPYNGSWLDIVGESFAVLLLVAGLFLLVVRRPAGWGIGLGMLILLLAGHLAHWFSPLPAGDFSGAVRLSQIAAYALLFALPQQVLQRDISYPASWQTAPQAHAAPGPNQHLQTFFDLAAARSPAAVYPAIARLISRLTVSDICLVVLPLEAREQMLLLGGYNLSKEQDITDFTLSGPLCYTIANALRRGRPIRLPSTSTMGDDLGIGQALGFNRLGHLLAAPIFGPDRTTRAGILLLAPYSNRGWSNDDQIYLVNLAEALTQVLAQVEQGEHLEAQLRDAHQAAEATQKQLQQIQQENEEMLSQLEEARQHAQQEHGRAESLAALVASQESAQEIITQLENDLRQAQADVQAKQSSPTDLDHLESELRLALEEITHLRTSLSEADHMIVQFQTANTRPLTQEQGNAIFTIAQELRQPMSSIIGYLDVLQSESTGLLGALQQKFLERIKISTERMASMVEDLIHLSEHAGANRSRLHNHSIDLNMVIDEAMAITIHQVREKNILLRVDIPKNLPTINVDHDALQQIVIHLLQNASSATPVEGEVLLHARIYRQDDQADNPDYVLLQVSDRGGGIASKDLPRLFSRLYRSNNNTIPGAGETGVGLAIVKSLVEAQGGRIWVDTEINKGSTFSVLLPMAASIISDNGYGGEAQ